MRQVLIAIDQLANTLLGGWADETLSSRTWRQHKKKKRWCYMKNIIEAIFFWQEDHCKTAYESELKRTQAPEELRPKT